MRFSLIPIAASYVLVTGCAGNAPRTAQTDEMVKATIDSLDQNVQRWLNSGSADSAATGYYASDALVMDPGAPAMKGVDAIRSGLTEMFKTSAIRLHFERSSIFIDDSLASDQGHFTLRILGKPDTTKVLAEDHGNYVTTFVRRNGQWRAVYDIATSEVPATAPAKPAAKK